VRWGVVLVACSLPGSPGAVEIAEQIQAEGFKVHPMAFGTLDSDHILCRLWRAGVLCCVPEEAAPEIIMEAVRAAARGRSLWAPEQLAQAQRWWDEVGCKLEALTGRERQVLALMAEGLSNRQIAQRLRVGVKTIQAHVSNILSKLGLETRQQAIVFVLKRAN